MGAGRGALVGSGLLLLAFLYCSLFQLWERVGRGCDGVDARSR